MIRPSRRQLLLGVQHRNAREEQERNPAMEPLSRMDNADGFGFLTGFHDDEINNLS